ncbi:MAG: aspartate/glutamate racemase family protein [Vampirovibrionales bacterium]
MTLSTPTHSAAATPTIGVFDSGVGGLTVLAPLMARYPMARFVYVADNAYMPYGDQPPTVLLERLTGLLPWLAQRCDAIALACNTAASLLIEHQLLDSWGVPVVDPVQPVCEFLAQQARASTSHQPWHVTVLATPKTTQMGVYPRQLASVWPKQGPSLQVVSVSGRELAGYFEHGHPNPQAYQDLLDSVAESIKATLTTDSQQRVILGCTHYPHMRRALAERLPSTVVMVDPAEAMVAAMPAMLLQQPLAPVPHSTVLEPVTFYVTGDPQRFQTVAQQCSGLTVVQPYCLRDQQASYF